MTDLLHNKTTLEMYVGLAKNELATNWKTNETLTQNQQTKEIKGDVSGAYLRLTKTQDLTGKFPEMYTLAVFEDSNNFGAHTGIQAKKLYEYITQEMHDMHTQQTIPLVRYKHNASY